MRFNCTLSHKVDPKRPVENNNYLVFFRDCPLTDLWFKYIEGVGSSAKCSESSISRFNSFKNLKQELNPP
ncbi:hypothetical protein GCM10008986_29850 [Salinibacillus aidingensis]|uniref:Uncharacterized protein n=1 Tax=Salinibacillus aidingensis TaxID=237684 RepID=A0ABN1BN73_9BACI